jgi:hypothetical protein
MSIVLRRLTIVTLIMTIFALGMSALVAQPGRAGHRLHVSMSAS